MDRVDLYPGGYPAQFGRYAGGIVSGETKAPAHELHGEANVRLVDAGAMIEAPLSGVTVPLLAPKGTRPAPSSPPAATRTPASCSRSSRRT